MKILYHHRTLGDGAEGIHIREMVQAFREGGHEVQVVSIVDNGSTAQAESSVTGMQWVKHLFPKVAYEALELGYNIVGRRRLDHVIRDFHPDLVFDRYNTFCTAALTVGRSKNIPVFLEINAPLSHERIHHDRGLFFAKQAVRLEKIACELATKIFVVSTPLREFLVENRDVTQNKIIVLPNGVNTAQFTPRDFTDQREARQTLGIPDSAFVIGFTGILRPWHGIEMLCEVIAKLAKRHPNLHLLIIGDGPSEEEIREKVAQLGIQDRVTITGRVSHEQVAEHLAAADIAVSPRATFYASPMKIVEYMAMGIPVVAPDMPNICDLVANEVDAVLFNPDDQRSLEFAIEKLIVDPEMRARLRSAGLEKVEKRLNWKQNALEVIRHFESLSRQRMRMDRGV